MGSVPFERMGVQLLVGAFDRREKARGEREGRRFNLLMVANDESAKKKEGRGTVEWVWLGGERKNGDGWERERMGMDGRREKEQEDSFF